MVENRAEILRTIAYSDIFSYPLTIDEIHHFLMSDRALEKGIVIKELAQMGKHIVKKGRYHCLKNRVRIVASRLEKEKENERKISLAQSIAAKLAIIPTVRLVGISGAVALKAAEKTDDIDLFVITKAKSLWITRLLLIVFLEFLGARRRPNMSNVTNKICLNMLLDEAAMRVPRKRQDVYTAHEIVQMLPLFERENMYQKFLEANIWVKKYLVNALYRRSTRILQSRTRNNAESIFSRILLYILSVSAFEFLAKKAQLWVIEKRRTIEIISDQLLMFHPFDYRKDVLGKYQKLCKRLGV